MNAQTITSANITINTLPPATASVPHTSNPINIIVAKNINKIIFNTPFIKERVNFAQREKTAYTSLSLFVNKILRTNHPASNVITKINPTNCNICISILLSLKHVFKKRKYDKKKI